jgi:hypothetical protein
MSRKNVRVVIPRNADKLVQLGEDIVEQHVALGANSPLNGFDMGAFAALVADAKAKGASAKKLKKDSETAKEDRDSVLGHRKDQNSNTEGTVLNFVVRFRETLLGVHKGKEQHLGDFGFEVNQSIAGTTTPDAPEKP